VTAGLDGLRLAWGDADAGDRRQTSRRLLGGLLPGSEIRSGPCARCGGAHGRPYAAGSPEEISVSYAGGVAVVAVIPRTVAHSIGIDAERGHDDSPAAIDRMRPGATLRDWTRVEAALKADGRGLEVDPTRVRVEITPDGWIAAVPDRPTPILGRDVAGPAGVVLSVAIVPAETVAVRVDPPSV
jgi:4'-phosphopantetheinyl transferase